MTDNPPPPALDPGTLPGRTGSGYPEPFRTAVAGRPAEPPVASRLTAAGVDREVRGRGSQ